MAPSVLDIRGLSYCYPGADRNALRDLAFTVEEGEIFGFLGPNGSGKSTTQKLLTGILHGYESGIEVFGRNLQEQGSDYYNSIGVSFEFPNLYEKLTAEENLDFYGAFLEGSTESAADVLKRLPSGRRPPHRRAVVEGHEDALDPRAIARQQAASMVSRRADNRTRSATRGLDSKAHPRAGRRGHECLSHDS